MKLSPLPHLAAQDFRLAVESCPNGMVMSDCHGRIVLVNGEVERLFGYDRGELIGQPIAILVPERLRDHHVAYPGDDVVRTPPAFGSGRDRLGRRKDGSEFPVEADINPIRPEKGRLVLSVIVDVTGRKQAHEMFELAVEACPSGMVMVDSAGRIVLVNGEIERLFDYDREQLIGHPIELLLPPGLRQQHAAHRQGFVAEPQTRRMGSGRDLLGRRRDGSEFPVEVGLNPISTEEGVVILGVIVDITERNQSAQRFEAAVEACPSGMMMIDGNGLIVLANREIERLFGYGRDELTARSIEILVPEGLRDGQRQDWDDFTSWPEVLPMGGGRDLTGLRKNGSEFEVAISLNPLQFAEDLMVLCVVEDVSERRRIERLKDEFVATVSHELRTPLTSIAASLGLLAGNSAIVLPDSVKRLITIAHTNTQRLVRLINDILDIEKIESGQVVFDLRRIEVRSLVEHAIEASRGLAQSQNVGLRLDHASVAAEVNADADRLTQVLVNLLSNAIKFSLGAGEVVVSVAHQNGVVRVGVRDHGPGIPESFKKRIFDKFAQADASDTRQRGGTGLGLSIVREIVARLEGEVGFSDAPGGGTIFHVDLPDWEHATGGDGEAEADRMRLLICDDYPWAAKQLARELAEIGVACDIASTAAEAIGRATARRYAAILIDLLLSDCDGVSLIRTLRALPQTGLTPMVVVSSDMKRGRDDLRSSSQRALEQSLHVLDWFREQGDTDRPAGLPERSGACGGSRRLHVLHLDTDPESLRVVAKAVSSTADVTSVATLDAAREALAANRVDLVMLDAGRPTMCGLELLPELHDSDRNAIPVIVLSAEGMNTTWALQIGYALNKTTSAIQGPIPEMSCIEVQGA